MTTSYKQLASDLVEGTVLLTFGADKLGAMTPLEDLELHQKADQAAKVVAKILEAKTRLVEDDEV